jgi:two-component system, chemotaxis family, chemotaxis protein CheY
MKHCLIVDDSRVVRTVARRILENLSYSVDEVEDGMTGLRACREKMPDLIFLDWNLPQMKGLEFIKSVRNQHDGRHPVILFSATERDPDEVASAFAAGADELVMKPFDVGLMRAKLESAGVAVPSDQRLSA